MIFCLKFLRIPYNLKESNYPDEMNDIILTASNEEFHCLTIHQPKEDVAVILRQLGF